MLPLDNGGLLCVGLIAIDEIELGRDARDARVGRYAGNGGGACVGGAGAAS